MDFILEFGKAMDLFFEIGGSPSPTPAPLSPINSGMILGLTTESETSNDNH